MASLLGRRLASATRPSAAGPVCTLRANLSSRACPLASAGSNSLVAVSASHVGRQQGERQARETRTHASAAAAALVPASDVDVGVSEASTCIIQYAIDLARTSECYEVHSWMLLLGILKYEKCSAAQILRELGLQDLYGAWHEVLWALNVCDGLKPRAFQTEVSFADRAFKVITASSDFAVWHGSDKMYSEDLLMALAAGGVLDGLFPDLNLSFERVRKAVEKHTGRKYSLPDDVVVEKTPLALRSDDEVFL